MNISSKYELLSSSSSSFTHTPPMYSSSTKVFSRTIVSASLPSSVRVVISTNGSKNSRKRTRYSKKIKWSSGWSRSWSLCSTCTSPAFSIEIWRRETSFWRTIKWRSETSASVESWWERWTWQRLSPGHRKCHKQNEIDYSRNVPEGIICPRKWWNTMVTKQSRTFGKWCGSVWKKESHFRQLIPRSVGCLLYEMCTYQHAFDGKGLMNVIYKVVEGKPPELPKKYSKELNDLLKKCVNIVSINEALSSRSLGERKSYRSISIAVLECSRKIRRIDRVLCNC